MRLLEYQVSRFCKDCIYNPIEKHECASNGFYLAQLMDKDIEFWLNGKDCTDKDFIIATYKFITETEKISELELIETLARFLCGYDKYEIFKQETKGLTGAEKSRLFDKRRLRVDDQISDEDLKDKIDFIEKCIEKL